MREYLMAWVKWFLGLGVVVLLDVKMALGVSLVLYLFSFFVEINTLVILSPIIILSLLLITGMVSNLIHGDPILEIVDDDEEEDNER